jgi:hypothetical protein
MEVEEPDTDDNREDDEGIYAGWDEVARMGFDVTCSLGELIFPAASLVIVSSNDTTSNARHSNDSTSVAAAVRQLENVLATVSLQYQCCIQKRMHLHLGALQIGPGKGAGRSGKGYLGVSSGPDGSFTQLSVYRYRAAAV